MTESYEITYHIDRVEVAEGADEVWMGHYTDPVSGDVVICTAASFDAVERQMRMLIWVGHGAHATLEDVEDADA